MAQHRLNPIPGDVWYHPDTNNQYRIHSLTDDGWVRYFPVNYSGVPLYTQPTLEFITKYRKVGS